MQSHEYFSNGEVFFEKEKFSKAIEMYNQALTSDDVSSHAKIYLKRGITYFKIKKYDEAIDDFGHLSTLREPNFKMSLVFLGIIFEYKADHCTDLQQKISYYKKAAEAYYEVSVNFIEANEKFKILYRKLTSLKLVANQICFPNGIKFIAQNSIINSKNNIEIHNDYIKEKVKQYKELNHFYNGDVYYYMGYYAHAIEKYSLSMTANASAEKYYRRGLAYLQLNIYKKAFQDFSKAIELNPNFTHAYLFRAFNINNDIHANHDGGFFFQIEDGWWLMINDLAKATTLEPNLIEAKHGLNHFFDRIHNNPINYGRLSPETQKLLAVHYPDDRIIHSNLARIRNNKQTIPLNTKYMSLGFLPRFLTQEKNTDTISSEASEQLNDSVAMQQP